MRELWGADDISECPLLELLDERPTQYPLADSSLFVQSLGHLGLGGCGWGALALTDARALVGHPASRRQFGGKGFGRYDFNRVHDGLGQNVP